MSSATALDGLDPGPGERLFGIEAPRAAPRHTPEGILAGFAPHVPGKEDEIVWNAASDACGSERLHYVWSVYGGRIWYLAVPSAVHAREPGTWCAFASLLPGTAQGNAQGACYIELVDGTATLLAYHSQGIEIYQGDLPQMQAKAETLARRIGVNGDDAPIIRVDTLQRLPVTPWTSLSLKEDRLRRYAATMLLAGGILMTVLGGAAWGIAALIHGSNQSAIAGLQAETEGAVRRLAQQAEDLSRSRVIADLTKLADVDRQMIRYGGMLRRYELRNPGATTWSAYVPIGLAPAQITELNARVTSTEGRYLVIEGTR